MAYIEVDIEHYLDEVGAIYLIEELRRRAKEEELGLYGFICQKMGQRCEDSWMGVLEYSVLQQIAISIGLNHLASKEDIIEEIKKL